MRKQGETINVLITAGADLRHVAGWPSALPRLLI